MILSLPNPAAPPEGAVRPAVWTPAGAAPGPTLAAFNEGISALDSPADETVPEPDTLALLGGALAVFALVTLIRRKRRRK